MEGVNKAIAYYTDQRNKVVEKINTSNSLSADMIIQYGEELAILEYKLTALEVAKEN